jgi:uncharacterized protein
MTDLATALALVLVLEGLLWALFPNGMKRVVVAALAMRNARLRLAGLAAMAGGVVLVWLIRG